MTRLAIVVPCYEEEAVLLESVTQLTARIAKLIEEQLITLNSFILFVNDGSSDNTWELIKQSHQESKYVYGLNLAANVGHQNALMAGLSTVVNICDAAITIDADLQDDVDAIYEMVQQFLDGNDIVYGVRYSRETDTWFKGTTAHGFYTLMQKMDVNIVYNHADYRLMSKRAILHLLKYRERNLFLRGIVPTIGYNKAIVYYKRAERFAGESKYPLKKMLSFAFDGITSFSIKPLHLVLFIGLSFIIVSFGIFIWVLYAYTSGVTVPGWTSLMISIWFCSGCLLTGLGVVGEYIGKIYIEIKDRPRFNIESVLMHE